MKKYIILGIAAFGGLLLVGAYLSQSTGNDTELSRESSQEIQAQLPPDLPAAIPTYPDARVVDSRSVESDSSTDFSFSLETTDSISDINNWYRQVLNENGWSVTSDKNVAGYQIIQAENENLYTTIQAANSSQGGSRISQQAKIRK